MNPTAAGAPVTAPAVGAPAAPRPLEAAEAFSYLRSLVAERSALALGTGKEYLAEARLGPLARRQGMGSVWELLLQLKAQPPGPLHTEVVEAMTTNETSFFRDPTLFDAIGDVIIPDLVARRADQRRLTIWSAACSTGQEPYSLAMLVRERPSLAAWNVRIVASDLAGDVLARASTGRFSRLEANRGLAANRLVRWFTQVGTDWQVAAELRAMVEFRQLNLAGSWPLLPQMDLVLLRNVLIYFPVAAKQQVLAQVRKVLRPDGYLILGNAETTFNLDDRFERVGIGKASAYRLVSSAEGKP